MEIRRTAHDEKTGFRRAVTVVVGEIRKRRRDGSILKKVDNGGGEKRSRVY